MSQQVLHGYNPGNSPHCVLQLSISIMRVRRCFHISPWLSPDIILLFIARVECCRSPSVQAFRIKTSLSSSLLQLQESHSKEMLHCCMMVIFCFIHYLCQQTNIHTFPFSMSLLTCQDSQVHIPKQVIRLVSSMKYLVLSSPPSQQLRI